ncbi:hypothetical protein [Sphingobium sp. SA916]|uniref:hypothetical protein n=1 Tax=Sphingobium sp. SA916 TaxID=1851207 RepID=UPI000C9FE334|nr:hypothetical protein [Sphingobium sp. SA916]PNQ04019.1 hypothetical protein A8G00_09055 [Sphingobium sp. SA916]
MIEFLAPQHDDPALPNAHLLRAARLTLTYMLDVGPIGLTPNKALKRTFVTWAAEAFEWPYYTVEDLYAVNKVLNEPDFPPLMLLHDLLISAKLARHRKGFLHITATGKDLLEHPGNLWIALAHHLLFVLDHSRYTLYGDQLDDDWLFFLGVLNVEAHSGVTDDQFVKAVFDADSDNHRVHAVAYAHILRPLCWLGLLDETRYGEPYPIHKLFTKTKLWSTVIRADTDQFLIPASRH